MEGPIYLQRTLRAEVEMEEPSYLQRALRAEREMETQLMIAASSGENLVRRGAEIKIFDLKNRCKARRGGRGPWSLPLQGLESAIPLHPLVPAGGTACVPPAPLVPAGLYKK